MKPDRVSLFRILPSDRQCEFHLDTFLRRVYCLFPFDMCSMSVNPNPVKESMAWHVYLIRTVTEGVDGIEANDLCR